MKELLFSYGTLQLEKVQMESFGRKLHGTSQKLKGYKVEQLRITNPTVPLKSEKEFHPIAIRTNNQKDEINGILYEITANELELADQYGVAEYKKVKVLFSSGTKE